MSTRSSFFDAGHELSGSAPSGAACLYIRRLGILRSLAASHNYIDFYFEYN